MKKAIFSILIAVITISSANAQDENGGETLASSLKGDRIVVDIFTDMWQGADDGISISSYSPGASFYGMYNLPFGKSKFGLGFGFGFGTHNMRSNAMPVAEVVYDSINGNVETGNTVFQRIPGSVNTTEIEYDINKLTLSYFDIPVELRYRKENEKEKAFRFYIGAKIGYLLNSHIKYKGIGFKSDNLGKDVKYKEYKVLNIEPLRYGLTLRVGYSYFNLFGYYSLSKIFKDDKGPEMYPISAGISITI